MRRIADNVVRKFGGIKKTAHLLGISYQRVYRWTYPTESGGTGGIVPAQYHEPLLELAERHGIELTPYDFVEWRPGMRRTVAAAAARR